MLKIFQISLLIQVETNNQSCGQLYIEKDDVCICPYFISANNSLCVQNCSDIGEFEVNGTCIAMIMKKQSCSDNACCSDKSYGYNYVWSTEKNQCVCPPLQMCSCLSEECCQKTLGIQYHLINGKCQNCSYSFAFGSEWDGKKCVCLSSQCYCTTEECCLLDNKHYINYKCNTCENSMGSGYTWKDNRCQCETGNTCTCQTQECCAMNSQQIQVLSNGKCKLCKEIYNANSGILIPTTIQYCKCDADNQAGNIFFNQEFQNLY
ncbi:Hypothetical_protein [Hexamita inflata]|uniref:Hypothetical_protein n=1 Tax=Hexamita inflata TaxID=28002 RepID=A0AA86R1B3_9EUKA|nr:Hypothetical protein HINF_LOCUS18992 [Hexamita inflata]CAI9967282.1 Hypothetical protein HINF_LOCUS54927 [Hexamita inflata]